MDLLEIKLRNQEMHQNQWQKYEDGANKIFIDVSKLLITLATGLFTFTSPVFQDIGKFTEVMKTLIFLGWLFLLISICAGVIQLWIEKHFFEKQAGYYTFLTYLYAGTEPTDEGLAKAAEEKQKENIRSFSQGSNLSPFYIQVLCFLCAIVFFLIVFYKILFLIN